MCFTLVEKYVAIMVLLPWCMLGFGSKVTEANLISFLIWTPIIGSCLVVQMLSFDG